MVALLGVLLLTGAVDDLVMGAGGGQPTPVKTATVTRGVVISSVSGVTPTATVNALVPQPAAPVPSAAPVQSGGPQPSGASPALPAAAPNSALVSASPGVRPQVSTSPQASAPSGIQLFNGPPTATPSGPGAGIQSDLNAIKASATALAQEVGPGSSGGAIGADSSATAIPTAAPPFVPTPVSPR